MTETGASGHAVKAVHHTGGAGSPSFSGLSVLCINNIGGFKTGTGAAGHGTGSAGNTSGVEFIPHRMRLQFVCQIEIINHRKINL